MTPPSGPSQPSGDMLSAILETLDELDAALTLTQKALERARALTAAARQDRPPAPRPMWAPPQRGFGPSPSWPVDHVGPLTFGSADPDEPDNPDDFPPETLAAYRGTPSDSDPTGG